MYDCMFPTEEHIKELQDRIGLFEDEVAYKQLFLLLFPSLCGLAHSITRSRELAEEISSDIFISLWANRANIKKIDNLKLYLFIAVRNQSVKALNKEKKKNTHVSFDGSEIDFVSDYATPEESTEVNELHGKIQQAIRELPARCQLIFKLAKEDKLRHKEISNLLNISIKTIDSQIAIAVKKIGAAIGGYWRITRK